MNDRERESAARFFAGFPHGDATDEEITLFHKRKFSQFQFSHADIAEYDGRELSDLERGLIMASMGQEADQVKVYGEPDEALYIDYMVNMIERDRLELPGKAMVKADRYLKFLKARRLSIKGGASKTMEYKSIVRARAFCVSLLQINGIVNFFTGTDNTLSRDAVEKFTNKQWPGQSGQTVYREVNKILPSDITQINPRYLHDHQKDYEHGLRLFNEIQ